jgi:hypothetical protein
MISSAMANSDSNVVLRHEPTPHVSARFPPRAKCYG